MGDMAWVAWRGMARGDRVAYDGMGGMGGMACHGMTSV